MRVLLGAFVAALLAALATPGAAAEAAELRIREVSVEEDGATSLLVSVTGEEVPGVLAPDAFQVSENGEAVPITAVEPLFDSEVTIDIVVALVLDLSGSMEGEPLVAAKAAARDFVEAVSAKGVEVMLVTFADEANVVVAPTTDAAGVAAAIEQLEADGETAFFDGVALGIEELAALESQRHVLAFTDGADTASQLGLSEVVDAALGADTVVDTVFLEGTSEFDPEAVEQLASATGGTVLSAGSTADLAAAFEEVVSRLASQYVLTYAGTYAPVEELELTVQAQVGSASLSDTAVALNTRTPPPPEVEVVDIPEPGFVADPTVRDVGVYAVGASLALLLGAAFVRPTSTRAGRFMRRSLGGAGRVEPRAGSGRAGVSANAIGRRAVALVDQLPKPSGSDERLQLKLDRAAWPLRSSEFILLSMGTAVIGLALGWGLLGSAVLGLLLLAVGAAFPYVLLGVRLQRRLAAFEQQLPDTLQLLAGSLKAGYGMLQAIDTVQKEAGEPISSEFRRVLTESRLGLPFEESLDAMAERVGSEDFRWVVVATNIQRRIGGNLAELLGTVAETLRQREQVRRQIKVLSAEGRLSAAVLVGLPFVLVAYLLTVNPEYLSPLFREPVGRLMLAGAVAMMAAGILWMRRLITIDV